MAVLLDVNTERLVEHVDCKGSADQNLSESGKTFIKYYLTPDLYEEDSELAPIKLVRNLNKKKEDIKKFIPKLADGDLLLMEEITKKEPYYTIRPYAVAQNYTSIAFNTTFTDCGHINVIAEEVPFSRWYLSTNSTLFFFENQLIRMHFL